MNKKLSTILYPVLLLGLLSVMACNSGQKNGVNLKGEKVAILSDTLSDDNTIDEVKPDSIILPEIYDEGIDIQLTGLFRGNEPSDFDDLINGSWYELYYDDQVDDFYLTEAIASVTKEIDECLGGLSTYVSSKHKIEPMLFIKGLNEPAFKIHSLKLKEYMIWPEKSMTFTFNDQDYILEGEGHVLSDEPVYNNTDTISRWQNVINYRLYLTANVYGNAKKQLLIAIPSFNDTFVQIMFIGDLDNDGNPDFVFDVSRDYEEKAVILMLSSKAKNGEFVRCVGGSSYQFDC